MIGPFPDGHDDPQAGQSGPHCGGGAGPGGPHIPEPSLLLPSEAQIGHAWAPEWMSAGAVLVPAWFISGYALGPLFLVADWFSARSLACKGAGAFARARLLRLGVPLVAFIVVINPLANYVGERGQGRHPSLAHDLSAGQGAGPMWFVAALLAFSLTYALLRRCTRRRPRAGGPAPR